MTVVLHGKLRKKAELLAFSKNIIHRMAAGYLNFTRTGITYEKKNTGLQRRVTRREGESMQANKSTADAGYRSVTTHTILSY